MDATLDDASKSDARGSSPDPSDDNSDDSGSDPTSDAEGEDPSSDPFWERRVGLEMRKVHKKTPREGQVDAVLTFVRPTGRRDAFARPKGLFIAPTGFGKSLVTHTIGALYGGIVILSGPLTILMTDQLYKLKHLPTQKHGRVDVLNLDDVPSQAEIDEIKLRCENVGRHSSNTPTLCLSSHPPRPSSRRHLPGCVCYGSGRGRISLRYSSRMRCIYGPSGV